MPFRISHSSTESEIISLDAGLRLDGIPALDLWDLIVSVFWKRDSDPCARMTIRDTEKISLTQAQGDTQFLSLNDCVSTLSDV